LNVTDGFIVRRLAPDSRKAELSIHPGAQLEEEVLEKMDDKDALLQKKLLNAMGREIASLHAATADVHAVLEHLRGLKNRDVEWLHLASKKAAQAVEDDFNAWAGAAGASVMPT
jgi:hypothetical protein